MPDPFTSLLDLDRGRLPDLALRLDGKDYPLRAPEALPMGDAFRLGVAYERMRNPGADPAEFKATARGIVAIIAPELPVALGWRQDLTLVAFYSRRLAEVVERLRTPAGDPVPFSTPARGSSRRRKSRRASASDSGRSSPCP